ncbi:aspartate--ammonia ligase [bacterium]|nr:aspartate--ammonia ligase [bacterium]
MNSQVFKKIKNDNSNLRIPNGYNPCLNIRETENAIKFVKDLFQLNFKAALNLIRVSAPLIVLENTGINDQLNGSEKPICFDIPTMNVTGEIVQSLAKWKRKALLDYNFDRGEGLYTDMNAIRPTETPDNLHSFYVAQWDWEQNIFAKDRNLTYLKEVVKKIYQAIRDTERSTCEYYKSLPKAFLPEKLHFIHSEDLEDMYPDSTPAEREHAICKEKGAVFIIGVGANLKNGLPHDNRAADYDDWSTETGNGKRGLNGDILVWYPMLECAYEISSMGIRVNESALSKQLALHNEKHKRKLPYHKSLLAGELPLSIGGGIGQSRLCMLFLRKAHIGEVQASIWPETMRSSCAEHGIPLL